MDGEPQPALDTHTPNIARMYDYWLGGKDNFAADREAAEKVIALSSFPGVQRDVREHRAFLGRAVDHMAQEGIGQFLDIGTGLPTQGNIHSVARRTRREARVVYSDHDPVVSAHARALLLDEEGLCFVEADLRNPPDILNDPQVKELIDFDEPVAVLLTAVLHHIPGDDRPHEVVARYVDAMVPGSFLMISHLSSAAPGPISQAARIFDNATAGLYPRPPEMIHRFFDGFDLLSPGLVTAPAWRPEIPRDDSYAAAFATLVGVGRRQ